jgi:hypothetical protein
MLNKEMEKFKLVLGVREARWNGAESTATTYGTVYLFWDAWQK